MSKPIYIYIYVYIYIYMYILFYFIKKLKHVILAADYMKKNYSVNWAGLCTKTKSPVIT